METIHYLGRDLPACYEVCGTCDGRGKHMTPSIRDHAYTSEEMWEAGDDFIDAYFNGGYDVVCHECKGQRVTLVLDLGRIEHMVETGQLPEDFLAEFYDELDADAEAEAEHEHWRRACANGHGY